MRKRLPFFRAYSPIKYSRVFPRKERKWRWDIFINVLSSVVSITAIIIATRSCSISNYQLTIQRYEYKNFHRPQLDLITYASLGTDAIFKGTIREDTSEVTGSYWIANNGSANLVIEKIQLPADLHTNFIYSRRSAGLSNPGLPYLIHPKESILISCSLNQSGKPIQATEEVLKGYIRLTCADEVGTKYFYDFYWNSAQGLFIGFSFETK